MNVEEIKDRYPKGTRVRCIRLEDPYTSIPRGTEGTVSYVDDIGTIHVVWSTGSGLGLIPGVDLFEIIAEKEHADAES